LKYLDLNDLLVAAERLNAPWCSSAIRAAEALQSMLAEAVASAAGCTHTATASEGMEFGGLLSGMCPTQKDDKMPSCFEDLDPEGEWDWCDQSVITSQQTQQNA
jgi:hypothetical protein